jgi:hypothetical protein
LFLSVTSLDFGICPRFKKSNPNYRKDVKEISLRNQAEEDIYFRFDLSLASKCFKIKARRR